MSAEGLSDFLTKPIEPIIGLLADQAMWGFAWIVLFAWYVLILTAAVAFVGGTLALIVSAAS